MKEVTTALIHRTIEFVAEIYLRCPQNQIRVQKKLNSTMRMLLDRDFDASCKEMMFSLNWLNVRNMWHWCCIRTLKKVMKTPSQAPLLWTLLDQNEDPERPLRYNGMKVKWRKFTRWARESYAYCSI